MSIGERIIIFIVLGFLASNALGNTNKLVSIESKLNRILK
jgi:hypothetical protein